MTRRVTISVPDDIADRLEQAPNVSSYVTAALREQMDREDTRATLAEHGIEVTPAGLARARARIDEARSKMTPERYAELREIGRKAA